MEHRKIKKILLSVIAAAVLLGANVRVVYAARVDGEELDGTFTGRQLAESNRCAAAAAEEIARAEPDAPELTRHARLTLKSPDGDTATLIDACLERTGGVQAAWLVTVGGERAGVITDPTALGEAVESILALGAVDGAVAADLTEEVRLSKVYIPEGQADDMMAVAKAIRGLTQVVSHTADGTVRYG